MLTVVLTIFAIMQTVTSTQKGPEDNTNGVTPIANGQCTELLSEAECRDRAGTRWKKSFSSIFFPQGCYYYTGGKWGGFSYKAGVYYNSKSKSYRSCSEKRVCWCATNTDVTIPLTVTTTQGNQCESPLKKNMCSAFARKFDINFFGNIHQTSWKSIGPYGCYYKPDSTSGKGPGTVFYNENYQSEGYCSADRVCVCNYGASAGGSGGSGDNFNQNVDIVNKAVGSNIDFGAKNVQGYDNVVKSVDKSVNEALIKNKKKINKGHGHH